MQIFIPKYSKFTYLYYPLFIGSSMWMCIASINSYWKGVISLPILLFLMAVVFLLLWWIYFFTKNKFKSIVFYDNKLLFTNVFGQRIIVNIDKIKGISSIGLKIKGRIPLISLYNMDNNHDLYFHLVEWMRREKQNNIDEFK